MSWSLHNGSRIFLGTSQLYGLVKYDRPCKDGIYFDKILVSKYKLYKRSNKANLFYIPGPVACFSDEVTFERQILPDHRH
jgi:hypothetical protein